MVWIDHGAQQSPFFGFYVYKYESRSRERRTRHRQSWIKRGKLGGEIEIKIKIEIEMQSDEARVLLGFPSNSHPSSSEVKAAYKRKAWEFHPDRFPLHEKPHAESKFKLISEAYSCLQFQSCKGMGNSGHGTYTQVVRTGVPRVYRGRSNHHHILASAPFFILIMGTLTLGGFNASRAYQRQKEAYPSHNPFLP